MKGLRGLFFISIIVGLSSMFFKLLSKHLFTLSEVNVVFDALCADELQHEVKNYLQTTTPVHCVRTLCMDIKQHFPIAKDITYWQKHRNKCLLRFELYQPVYIINQVYLMLESGLITKKDYFVQESTDSLYHLSVEPGYENIPITVTNWLAESSDELFDLFSIHIINPTEIILSDKQSKHFSLRCHYAINLTQKLLARCLVLKDEIQRLASTKKRRGNCWVADLRFDKQIILYGKRGNDEGKSIF